MSEQKNKILGHSLDIPADKKAQLKVLFPTVFTETTNNKGQLVESVDFEKLKAELGTFTELFDSRRERYGMDWPGKKDALRLIQTPSYATLKPCREESLNFDTTENLFIEGDNLEVLKLLQKSYYGKVKMIVIDPPYNTKKDFIYNDNFGETLESYLEFCGVLDKSGRKIWSNNSEDGRKHTKWLNMMYPRLYLARNLLREDGLIFIHIDDNEVSSLRKICDEIFSEDNFLSEFVWNTEGHTDNQLDVKINHEYILAYIKNSKNAKLEFVIDPNTRKESNLWKGFAENSITKNGPGNPPSEVILPVGFPCDAENLFLEATKVPKDFFREINYLKYISRQISEKYGVSYPVRLNQMNVKNFTLIQPCAVYCGWSSLNKLNEFIKNNCQPIDDNGDKCSYSLSENGVIYYKKERLKARNIVSVLKNFGTTEKSRSELEKNGIIFQYPKPIELVNYLVEIGSNKNDIILDFFSGSATTAHAILNQNKKEGENRKFILVQLPEPCAEDSEAFKSGYKTIADIGKERIRVVIKNIESEIANKTQEKRKNEKNLFSDDDTSTENTKPLDLGFKVLKLDKSNFKQWQKLDATTSPEKIEGELLKYVDHINPGATQEDLLYEILLKAGFQPTEKIEILEFKNGKLTSELTKNIDKKAKPAIRLFSVADGGLLLCLEDNITKEVIEAVVELPTLQQFICLDSAFHGNDQLKANVMQTFAALNMQKEKHNQIFFKTV